MRKVLVFKETLLPPSETFILAQMMALTRHTPLLAGLEPSPTSLLLPKETLLLSRSNSAFSSFRAKLYRRSGIAPRFHQQARQFCPDVLHAHFASGGRTALYLARYLRVPLIVTLHGSDVTIRSAGPGTNKRLAEVGALFVCVSEFIRDRALEAGFPAEKLVVLHIGINREIFLPSEPLQPSKRILFVGRLVEKKGCEYLLRGMQLVQRTHPEAELTVIGDGPLRAGLERLANELKINGRFLGVQPTTAVEQALRETRLLCAPSVTAANGDSEGLPTVIAEALAMGVPVVASAHAGIPEVVIDGKTGVLTPERDYHALADGLSLLLDDQATWERLRSGALQHTEQHFDLKKQTSLLEDLYIRVSKHA